ncbi:MAG TPA: putative toxin-antitoxin system toxin component, PIN family [Candidatus Paceibacterota bacterium]|nr:putative toxin-antitoxin system toxin component, PIN family [Candidatus Paceibacterota bacterium]
MDTNVVVSAAFWPRSEDRRCFVLLARRKCRLAVTADLLEEYRTLATRIGRRECPDKDPSPFLDWIERVALLVEPAPLGKRRSRDAKDDPFLACALASRAEFIVTKDKDLLALDKPFGVEIVTPREFHRRWSS